MQLVGGIHDLTDLTQVKLDFKKILPRDNKDITITVVAVAITTD